MDLQGVQSGGGLGGVEGEQIAVAYVCGERCEGFVEVVPGVEVGSLSACQGGHLGGQIFLHCAEDHAEGFAEIEVCLIDPVANFERWVEVGILLECVFEGGLLWVEGEGVDRGVCLTGGSENFFDRGFAAYIGWFTE